MKTFLEIHTGVSLLWRSVAAVFLAIVFVSCSDTVSSVDENTVEYLAVQKDSSEYWSILDRNGNIVVKEEYPNTNVISRVYEDKVFWVGSDDKYSLFSIDSPKKPISEGQYDHITNVNCGRAFVANVGNPIILIGSNGKHIKTLDRSVALAFQFKNDLAPFQTQDGLWGYLNKDGDIAIEPRFSYVSYFYDSYAYAELNNNGETQSVIIDKKGKVITTLDTKRYTFVNVYQEGKINAVKDNETDNASFVALDKDGKEIFEPVKGVNFPNSYKGGYVVALDHSEYAVLNDKGESVIRKGKYNLLYNFGNGYFLASKDQGHNGIIDENDNSLTGFDYNSCFSYLLGDNFVLRSGRYYVLVNKKGEELKNSEFYNYSCGESTHVTFEDINARVEEFLEPITTKGYAPFGDKTDAPSVVKMLHLELDSVPLYSYYLETEKKYSSSRWDITTTYNFSSHIKVTNFVEEKVNDGWFEETITKEDGQIWNPESMLISVKMTASTGNIRLDDIKKVMTATLKKKGFKQDGESNVFDATYNDHNLRVLLNYYNGVELIFFLDTRYIY